MTKYFLLLFTLVLSLSGELTAQSEPYIFGSNERAQAILDYIQFDQIIPTDGSIEYNGGVFTIAQAGSYQILAAIIIVNVPPINVLLNDSVVASEEGIVNILLDLKEGDQIAFTPETEGALVTYAQTLIHFVES